MRSGIEKIIGKTIAHIVVGTRDHHPPQRQVFLVFEDGTHFEFYSGDCRLTWTTDVRDGGLDHCEQYARGWPDSTVETVIGPTPKPATAETSDKSSSDDEPERKLLATAHTDREVYGMVHRCGAWQSVDDTSDKTKTYEDGVIDGIKWLLGEKDDIDVEYPAFGGPIQM